MFDQVVFFGLLPKLRDLQDAIFRSNFVKAEKVWHAHFGNPHLYNKKDWFEIRDLGYLPLRIRAVPEGTIVPPWGVMMTVENTDKRFPWLTNWVETQLMQVWYPITVATLSREIKRLLRKYLEITGDPSGIDFKLHDFGFRGVSSMESAAIGGAAHLLNFLGTDTPIAMEWLEYHYGAKIAAPEAPGYSIPASEHSTITSWGREHEVDAYKNMLDQYPDALVACVSDSYDVYHACRNLWGDKLKAQVLDRKGTLVVRPDSGYPPDVVVNCLEILGKAFGVENNSKGFKVLNPKVRLIQGDGVDYDMIRNVLSYMHQRGWATDNVAFGMGGALLQKLNRDTQRMAFKCSAIEIKSVWTDVFKDPVTDTGKRSQAGRLALVKDGFELKTVPGPHKDDILQDVFLNGKILQIPNFYEIRDRVKV